MLNIISSLDVQNTNPEIPAATPLRRTQLKSYLAIRDIVLFKYKAHLRFTDDTSVSIPEAFELFDQRNCMIRSLIGAGILKANFFSTYFALRRQIYRLPRSNLQISYELCRKRSQTS